MTRGKDKHPEQYYGRYDSYTGAGQVLAQFKASLLEQIHEHAKMERHPEVMDDLKNAVREADDFLGVLDAVKADNYMDEADLFRELVDAIEEAV